MAIIWNGAPLEFFSPSRGLRQGDPLSPYLFVMCMERLSHLISKEVVLNNWKGLKASKGGPSITHLFFADDLVLFAKTTNPICATVMNTLDIFCNASRQKVNSSKSKFFVSPNLSVAKANFNINCCGIPLTRNLGKYLGFPLLHI